MQSSASASPLHQHVIPSTQAVVDKGKRRALDFPSNSSDPADDDDDDDDEWCLICHTHPIVDRTFLPACLHSQFCFVCILRWIDIKRTCPLCLRSIGNFVIHSVRSDDDFLRYHLPPPPLLVRSASTTTASTSRREITTQVQRARTTRVSHTDPLQANVLAFRRFVYRNSLYAHHIGSNPRTGFSAAPTPARIRHDTRHATGEIVTRISTFLRRELSLFPGVDVEFVTKYVVSLTQVWPLPDDSMVKLVAEVLGEEAEEGRARHLLHELECWLRSGRRELSRWDAVVQYGRGGGERWDGLGRRVVGKKRGRDVVDAKRKSRRRD
ncbi:RING-type domain-containing protein [Pseudozyma hubeiensis]|nr:RING-type domain-containing protein [Pseudozyma hubeiensis]